MILYAGGGGGGGGGRRRRTKVENKQVFLAVTEFRVAHGTYHDAQY